MKKQWRSLTVGCSILFMALSLGNAAPANKSKKKPTPPPPPVGSVVTGDDTFEVNVVVGKVSKLIKCFNETPGFIQANTDGTTSFVSFGEQISYLKKRLKMKRLSPKAKKNIKKEQANYAALLKAAGTECASPPFLELDPYTGTFGAAEARLLFERFAIGASPTNVSEAVAAGLDATIAKLTTAVPESSLGLDAVESDIRCDGYLIGHPVDKQDECTPGNLNDFSDEGLRLGIYSRLVLSPNPFFHKLFLFLHDERMAVSQQAASFHVSHESKKNLLEDRGRVVVTQSSRPNFIYFYIAHNRAYIFKEIT